jgi:hypothetical protein
MAFACASPGGDPGSRKNKTVEKSARRNGLWLLISGRARFPLPGDKYSIKVPSPLHWGNKGRITDE